MIDWRTLPPLTALRAFAALAETGTVTAAGARLNVSHAAISQQIRALEAHMNVPLVERGGRRLALTPEGRQLAEALVDGFGTISRTIESLTGLDADRPVQVSLTQVFATTWLMPRLADFQARNPGIDLMLNPSPRLMDPAPGGIDIALRFGSGDWPGLEAEMLFASDMVVAAAPSLVGEHSFDNPADLLHYVWLQEVETTQSEDWLRKHGVTEGRAKAILQVPGNLMLEGARAGQGVITTSYTSVAADVAAGRLRILFRDKGDTGYYIVTRPGSLRPQAGTFRRWLQKQAAEGHDSL